MAKKHEDSFKGIVGNGVYLVWVNMLKKLVPDGRTHRLSVTVASMLQYAANIAYEKYGDDPEEGSIAYLLSIASEEADCDEAVKLLLPIVEKLFKDSEVESKRINSKGVEYSIAESAIQEFVNWYNMPWE